MSYYCGVNLDEILNFVAVTESIATAGQPTEVQLRELRICGFEAIVNLGLLDPRYCLSNEADTVAELGMEYHAIPVDFHMPTQADFDRFRTTLRGLQGRKVLIHCAMNYRVACFMALYGEAELGWTREQADAQMKRLWEPNVVWAQFMSDLRNSMPSSD